MFVWFPVISFQLLFSSMRKRRDEIGLDRDNVTMIRVLEIEARVFCQSCMVLVASSHV